MNRLPLGPQVSLQSVADVCPYRGLEVFEQEHAEFFFGRDADVQRLLENSRRPASWQSWAPRGAKRARVRGHTKREARRTSATARRAASAIGTSSGGTPGSHLDQNLASRGGPTARMFRGLSTWRDPTAAFADPDKAILLIARALSDPVRLAIVRELAPHKRAMSDEKIAASLEVQLALVHLHVDLLLELGVLEQPDSHPVHPEETRSVRLAASARRELVWRRVLADSWSRGCRDA